MKEDKCFYLSVETHPETNKDHLQCINDECEYYLGFVDNGECETCKHFRLR